MPSFSKLGSKFEDDDSEEKVESVKLQLNRLFYGLKNPNRKNDHSKKDPFSGTKYESFIQEMIAKEFSVYSIISELKKRYGKNKHFRQRSVLGYVKLALLENQDNLKLITKMRYRYNIDRRDAQFILSQEVKERQDHLKSEKEQLHKMIDDLYERIEFLKEENRTNRFSSTIEQQITSNYAMITELNQKLKEVNAETDEFIINKEQVREDAVKFIIGSVFRNLFPHIPEQKRDEVKVGFLTEIQNWVNQETKLNRLAELKKDVKSLPKRIEMLSGKR